MVAVLSYMIMHHIKCFNSKSFFFFKYLQQVFQTYYSQESCWNCPSPWGLRLSPFDPSSTPISRFPCSLFISPFLFSSITPVRAQFSFLLSRGRNFHSLFIFILFCYIGSSIPFPSRSSSTLTSLLSFSRMLFSFFFFFFFIIIVFASSSCVTSGSSCFVFIFSSAEMSCLNATHKLSSPSLLLPNINNTKTKCRFSSLKIYI